jgi:hypothetical protein
MARIDVAVCSRGGAPRLERVLLWIAAAACAACGGDGSDGAAPGGGAGGTPSSAEELRAAERPLRGVYETTRYEEGACEEAGAPPAWDVHRYFVVRLVERAEFSGLDARYVAVRSCDSVDPDVSGNCQELARALNSGDGTSWQYGARLFRVTAAGLSGFDTSLDLLADVPKPFCRVSRIDGELQSPQQGRVLVETRSYFSDELSGTACVNDEKVAEATADSPCAKRTAFDGVKVGDVD